MTITEEIIVFSFSQQQLAHFQAFGFVVVRGMLDGRETAALTGEVTASLGEAFGGSAPTPIPRAAAGSVATTCRCRSTVRR